MALVGIDIGGTKVNICIGDQKGQVYISKRMAMKSLADPEHGVQKIVEVIKELLNTSGYSMDQIKGIGLAAPGPLCIKSGVLLTPPNLPLWVNVPIVKYLKNHFSVPVFMDNDANAGALAEWRFGEHRGVDTLVYLTMSTGMGGGVIIHQKIHRGVTDTAGEVGHFVLDPSGPECCCGLKGCFEVFCGGASVANQLKDLVKKGEGASLLTFESSVDAISIKTLIAGVNAQDSLCIRLWDQYMVRLSQGIGIILQTLNPDAIILGTIASNNKALVMNGLKPLLNQFAWKQPIQYCTIAPSELGPDIGVLGALAVAIDGLGVTLF